MQKEVQQAVLSDMDQPEQVTHMGAQQKKQAMRDVKPEAEQPFVIRTYKDTLFRMIFKDKEELLSLYNAVNDTHYADLSELDITTLENAVYMNVKNDVSCILDMRLNLYEHQSSVNPNMPLRDLFYVARQFQKLVDGKDLYTSKRISLPTHSLSCFTMEKRCSRSVGFCACRMHLR